MAKITTIYEVKTETGDSVNEINRLNKEIENLSDSIGIEVSSSISTMEDKLYDLALQGKQNTQEFKDLQKATARYKQVVIETDRSIDALAEQGRGLSNALAIAEGTVAGYQAFAGVSALLGEENEALLETMTKLQAAQGVLNSIMVIRQQLQEKSIALTRLQAGAQALWNAVTGTGTALMKAFRVALVATGIGALVLGLTLLVTNFEKLKGFFTGEQKIAKWFKIAFFPLWIIIKIIQTTIQGISELINMFTAESQARSAAFKKEEEERKKRMAAAKREREEKERAFKSEMAALDRTIALYKAQGKDVTELTKKKIRASIEAQKAIMLEIDAARALQRQYENSEDTFDKFISQVSKTAADESEKAQQTILDLENQLAIIDIEAENKRADRAKAASDKRKAEAKALADELFRLQQEQNNRMIALMQEIEKEEDALNTTKRQSEINAVTDHYFKLIEEAKQFGLDTESLEIARDKKLKELQDRFAQEDLERERKAQEMITNNRIELMEDGFEKEREKIVEKYKRDAIAINENEKLNAEERIILLSQLKEMEGQALLEISKKYADEEKKARIDAFKAYSETTINGLSAISSMNELVSDLAIRRAEGDQAKQEKIARRAFNINKALQLATATVQGIQAVQNAFTTASASPIAIANPAYPFIQATIAGATSAANIAKIASSRFEGGGGNVSPSGGGAIQGASASNFSISDNTNTNQTNLNPDGSVQGQGQGMQKVFVSETDISQTQNNVKQINTLSTF